MAMSIGHIRGYKNVRWWVWVILIGLLVGMGAFVGHGAGALVGVVVGGGLALGWWFLSYAWVQVSERQAAVVYRGGGQTFCRFLLPGRHWLQPGWEYIGGIIETGPQAARETSSAHLSGGIPVQVHWKMTYHLDPTAVRPESQVNMARTLAKSPGKMVNTHTPHCLQHLLVSCTLEELHAPGAQRRLENRLRGMVAERLQGFGFVVHRIILEEIELPEAVQKAIEAAYARKVSAQAEVEALAIRRELVRGYTNEDLQRLVELERLRVLDGRPGDTHVVLPGYHPANNAATVDNDLALRWALMAE